MNQGTAGSGKLTKAQYRVLRALVNDGPLTVGFLARALHRPMNTLVEFGFVAKRDGKWSATPAGRAALSNHGDER